MRPHAGRFSSTFTFIPHQHAKHDGDQQAQEHLGVKCEGDRAQSAYPGIRQPSGRLRLADQKVTDQAHGLICPGNGFHAVCLSGGQRTNGINRFRNDDGLVIDLIVVEEFFSLYSQAVLLQAYFPHVAARAPQVGHHLRRAV